MSYDHEALNSINVVFQHSIFESQSARKFLEEIKQFFAKNEKVKISNLLAKLIFMKYKGKGKIRKYIMKMSNLASKLKSLKSFKLKLDENLLMQLVFNSLPAHFGQFKRDKTKSAHFVSTSQNNKRKNIKSIASQQKKPTKDEEFTYYFCKKSGHMKKQCSKYAAWHVKKDKFLALVCFEVNLTFVPKDT
ncbi:hypothetical protein CR513_36476, partial [Mucuna pruriens]